MGTRILDIIHDKQEDLFYEDDRAMKLTHYVMAERCLQAELTAIFKDGQQGDYDTLVYLLEGGFKGFHNMEPIELIEEYNCIEDKWYDWYETNELYTSVCEDDPIINLEKENIG